MIHDFFIDRFGWHDFALLHQIVQVFGVMHDLVIHACFAAKLWIFIFDGVVTMSAGRDDFLEFVLRERFVVGVCLLFVQQFFAHPPRWIAGTGFFIAQNREIHASALHQLHHCAGGFLGTIIIRRRTTDPVQHVHCFFFGQRRHVQAVRPSGAVTLRQLPGIARTLDALQHVFHARRDFAHHHRQVAAKINDVVNVFNRGWAFRHTRPTGRATPQFIFGDNATFIKVQGFNIARQGADFAAFSIAVRGFATSVQGCFAVAVGHGGLHHKHRAVALQNWSTVHQVAHFGDQPFRR